MTDNLNSIVPMLKTMPYTIKSTAKPEFLPKTENDILQLNEKNKKKETIKYVSMATGIVLAIIAILKRKQISELFAKWFKKQEPINIGDRKPNLSTPKEPELKIKPTETTEPVPPLNKPLKTDLSNPLIERYEELKRTLKGQDGESYYTTQNKIKEIKKAAREGNISLVRKREFGLEASEIERLKYFEEEVFPVMDSSVQSTLDGLEMFNRYGLNKNDTSKGYNETTIGKLTLKALTRNPEKVNSKMMPEVIATDEVIRKYIEVFNKYANKDYKDSDHLSFIFENSYKIISEDTALRFIDTFKRFMYNQKTANNVQMHLTDGVMGRFKGNKEIEAAVDELIKYSETLPKK